MKTKIPIKYEDIDNLSRLKYKDIISKLKEKFKVDDKPTKYEDIENKGRAKYNEVKMLSDKTHHGQLKLFFSEMFFLTKCSQPGDTVLYVGAAEGYHTNKLVELFPELQYDLWDPRRFETLPARNVKINRRFFTDDVARKYKNGNKLLFMCDMRNLDIANFKKKEQGDIADNIVSGDMMLQAKWAKIMRPRHAFLKLRFPYYDYECNKAIFKYLKGDVYLQPFSPWSTEMRLLTSDYSTYIDYDAVKIDEVLAYFNSHLRINYRSTYWAEIMKKYKVKNIWDTIYSLAICEYYLRTKNKPSDDEDVMKLFLDIVEYHGKRYPKKTQKIIFYQ